VAKQRESKVPRSSLREQNAKKGPLKTQNKQNHHHI